MWIDPAEYCCQITGAGFEALHDLLSTAELIKCAELGVRDISTDEKLMDALYNDGDTTSDNIPGMTLPARSRERITTAAANLYLRKQIIFQ